MLESIKIRNFKRHEHLDAIFPDGLTICTGSNYQGKSSILQAILFAFFGVSAVPGGSKLAVRRGARPADLSVEVTIYHDGHRYTISRGANNASLSRDGELIATSKSSVSTQLEEVLGTPQKFFMRLKYAEQGETQALLTMGAEELHKIVEHVSGASEVNQVIAKASKRVTACTNRIEEVGHGEDVTPLYDEARHTQADMDEGEEKMMSLAQLLEVTREEHAKKVSQYRQAAARNEELAAAKARWQKLHHDKESWTGVLEQAQAALSEHQDLASMAEDLEQQYNRLCDNERRHTQLKAALRGQQESIDKLEADLSQARAHIERYEASLQSLGSAPDVEKSHEVWLQARDNCRAWQTELIRLEEMLKSGVCQSCHRPFEHFDVEDTKNKVQQATDALKASQTYEAQARAANVEAVSKSKQVGNLYQQLQALRDTTLPSLIKSRTQATEQLNAITAEAERCPPPAASAVEDAKELWLAANSARDIVTREADRLEQAKEAVHALEQQVLNGCDLAGQEPADTQALFDTTERLSVCMGKLQDDYRREERSVTLLRSKLTELQRRIDQSKQLTARSAELVKKREIAKHLVSYLKTNRDRFMAQLWGQVMGYATDFASACTGGAIERILRTEAGAFEFIEEGESLPLAAASGAQKSIMSIAVQLAFDALLPDSFGALLLDEPTSQMDESHALTLTQMLAESGRQIITVSHREQDAALAQAHIHLGGTT